MMVEGPIHRTDCATSRRRAQRVAQRLDREGIEIGDRVTTLAWNTSRHLKAWYGIMGRGGICHTLNPRLFPQQIAWIVDDAQLRVVLTDLSFIPLLERLAPKLPSVERYVILTDQSSMPVTSLRRAVAYEDWTGDADGDYGWKAFDEEPAAGLSYTSGTTGDPKGGLYSHRSNVLHTLMVAQGDVIRLKATDCVMPVVPLFHANGWGIPFHAPMVGSKLVFPGALMDGPSVFEMLRNEHVSMTAGVPTVWLQLQQHMEANNFRLSRTEKTVHRWSAPSPAMFSAYARMGIPASQGWGMTEMGPIGSVGMLKPPFEDLEGDEKIGLLTGQGVAPFLVEMKVTDDGGRELPRDGKAGHLEVRGQASLEGIAAATKRSRRGWAFRCELWTNMPTCGSQTSREHEKKPVILETKCPRRRNPGVFRGSLANEAIGPHIPWGPTNKQQKEF